MEPVDKLRARLEALKVLGLDQSASADDIRDAWRRIAFHVHPDHTSGGDSDFARAKAAYDLLRKQGLTVRGAPGSASRMPRRPKMRKRVIELEPADISACRALLDTGQALTDQPDADTQGMATGTAPSDHVPDAIGCHGRHLTYFVTSPVREGANRVALPTSVLAAGQQMETDILSFQSKDQGPGEVVVPDTIRARKFPGAKSVRIRFDADQQTRDEYWLAG